MADASDHMTGPDEASPAERRRHKVRMAILDAAERVFAEEGAEGLSIRRLAEEIDYSPAAIYKYFGSKEELVDELKESFFASILAQVDEVQSSDSPFRHRAMDCIKRYIQTALEKPQHYLAAFSGITAPDGGIDPASNKARAFEFLIQMVSEGQAAGHFDTRHPPDTLAKSVWACCHGAASLMAHMPQFPAAMPGHVDDLLDREGFLDMHAEVVLMGLYRR